MVALGLRDVEEGDGLALETVEAGRGLAGSRHRVGRIQDLFVAHDSSSGMSILLQIMRELLGNVQPGMTAEKRPAVPPATTNLRLPGSRNLAISVSSVGVRELGEDVGGQPLAA